MNAPTDTAILDLLAACGVVRGKKVFQKLCYFLQEAEGLQLGVTFRMKHYGPFSEELDEQLEDLASKRLARIDDLGEEGYRVQPVSADRYSEGQVSATVDRLLSKLGSEKKRGLSLEALATVHFLARQHAYAGSDEDKRNLIERVQAWKGPKFKPYFIREKIRELAQMGYLPTD